MSLNCTIPAKPNAAARDVAVAEERRLASWRREGQRRVVIVVVVDDDDCILAEEATRNAENGRVDREDCTIREQIEAAIMTTARSPVVARRESPSFGPSRSGHAS